MSDYIIKSYHEEYLEDQVKIGSEVTSEWYRFHQTPVDGLKEAYSQDDFDPSTRLYCFYGDTMVGFLPSKILTEDQDGVKLTDGEKAASIYFPFVLPEHQQAEKKLLERIEEILKERGVKRIQVRVGDKWGNTIKLAEDQGFRHTRTTAAFYQLSLKSMKIEEVTETFEDYNSERDREQLMKIFVEELEFTEDQAKRNFDLIDERGHELLLAHILLRDQDTIVARTLANKFEDPKRAQLGSMYLADEKYKTPLFHKILSLCKEQGVEMLETVLYGNAINSAEEYEQLGFTKTAKLSAYSKKI